MAIRCCSSGLVACLVLLLGTAAVANIRAPMELPKGPSSALYPAKGLTVEKEMLRLECKQDGCDVAATYVIQAEKALEVQLAFILPSSTTVKAKVGDLPVEVKVVKSTPQTKLDLPHGVEPKDLFEARFHVDLAQGGNRLTVTYHQGAGAYETDYGYGDSGRWVKYVQYELWPLSEWKLAKDFHIELTVRMSRTEAPGWWTRTFGTYRDLACANPHDGKAIGRAADKSQKGEYLVLETKLGADFPQRLRCYMSDDDIMPVRFE